MGVKGAGAEMQGGGKRCGTNPVRPLKRGFWSGREVGGMRGVAVKGMDITQNSD